MLDLLKSKLFCESTSSNVNLLLELVPTKNSIVSQKHGSHRKLHSNGYIATRHNDSITYCDQLYITLDFNCGSIRPDQDFLYLNKEEVQVKSSLHNINPNSIYNIDINRHDTSSGHCHIALNNLHLSQGYKMYYFRKDARTGKTEILYETKAFKIALKNKVHNLFLESVQNLDEQELAIFYEDDPFFSKIKARKNSSSDMTVFTTSTKKGSGSKNSRSECLTSHRLINNSIFTSSPEDDVRYHPSIKSISVNKELFQDHYSKQSKSGVKGNTAIVQEYDSNESVIINESRENDEYISKLCTALNENPQRNLMFSFHERGSSGPAPLINKDTLDSKSRNPRKAMEELNRKIFENGKSYSNENMRYGFQRRQARDFSSDIYDLNNQNQNFLVGQMEQRLYSRSVLKPIQEIMDYRENNDSKDIEYCQGTQSSNDGSVIILETTLEDEQDENRIYYVNTVSSREKKSDELEEYDEYEDDEDDSQSKVVFTTEGDQKDMPQFIDVEQQQVYYTYTPKYSDRLYTVEEVCSASKESSQGGWDLQFRMLPSGSESRKTLTNTTRLQNEKVSVRGQNILGDGKNLDFENLSVPVTQNSTREMPLEVMILKQKIENFGMRFEYCQKECSVRIQDAKRQGQEYFFTWYKETTDKDLYEYFEGIVESIKCIIAQ